MNIAWIINRLRAMEPREIVWRIEEQVRRQTARGRLDNWTAYESRGETPPTLPGLRDAIQAAAPELRTAIAAASARITGGNFQALGVDWPTVDLSEGFPGEIWSLDPVTGKRWPGAETFCFDISYRHAQGFGDIKYCWELNRLQFLQPVAAHFVLSGDEVALNYIEKVINSWFEHNPPYRGVGWNSGIELALRAISLLFVSSCCGGRLAAETRRRLRLILVAHAAWLARFPSGFSSANNHLIAELAGEFLIALAMPELPGAAATCRHARKLLEREAGLQILADGVGAEQSPTYGAFTAEFLLLTAQVARNAGAPLSEHVNAALTRFMRFIAWISTDDAIVPSIGDDDEGRVLTLADHEVRYPASIAAAIASFTKIPPAGPVPAEPDLRDAVFHSPKVGAPAPTGSRVFDSGGYSVYRGTIGDRRAMLVFDHGPLGYLSIAAHGHADALSIILFLDNEPVFVDPGTYLYHSGGPWRDWFRGTPAHNTLCVDGHNQSQISGAFNWSHKASATLVDCSDGDYPTFRARHDGYLKKFGFTHERDVAIGASGISLTDRLIGSASFPSVEITYQLAIGLTARVDGRVAEILRDGRPICAVTFPASGTVSVIEAAGPAEGGWVSEHFGSKVPAQRLVWATPAFQGEVTSDIMIT